METGVPPSPSPCRSIRHGLAPLHASSSPDPGELQPWTGKPYARWSSCATRRAAKCAASCATCPGPLWPRPKRPAPCRRSLDLRCCSAGEFPILRLGGDDDSQALCRSQNYDDHRLGQRIQCRERRVPLALRVMSRRHSAPATASPGRPGHIQTAPPPCNRIPLPENYPRRGADPSRLGSHFAELGHWCRRACR